MWCSSCDFDNAPGKKFCIRCGAELSLHCAKCGSGNPPGASFCGDCGATLFQPTAAPPSSQPLGVERVESRKVPEGERRQLTVMFCDVIGSTPLSERLDPEELRELMRSYQEVCVRAITSLDGYVGQYLGDGVLAYFDYPTAHEDDAVRAARAGLAIVEKVQGAQLLHPIHNKPRSVTRTAGPQGRRARAAR
jgi:ribosomal protein L40E